MSKEKSYREAAQYYHQPFALLREQRVRQLQQKMGIDGTGILLHIYLLLRHATASTHWIASSPLHVASCRRRRSAVCSMTTIFSLSTMVSFNSRRACQLPN